MWNIINNLIRKDVEVTQSDKCKKTPCATHLIIRFDSAHRNDKNHYHQILLEGCKYAVKNKIKERFLTEDLTDSESDSAVENESNY